VLSLTEIAFQCHRTLFEKGASGETDARHDFRAMVLCFSNENTCRKNSAFMICAHQLRLHGRFYKAVDGSDYWALRMGAANFLPLASGAHLARLVVLEHQDLQLGHLLVVGLNSLFYLALSMFFYKKFEHVAKKKNLTGQH
jgi:hypothetical protein